jgi:hypothetical protein
MWDFRVDKMALEQVFSEHFSFLCQFLYHRLLHTHHLSSGAGTIGRIVADVPSGLSLTPPPDTKKKLPCYRSSASEMTPMDPSRPDVWGHEVHRSEQQNYQTNGASAIWMQRWSEHGYTHSQSAADHVRSEDSRNEDDTTVLISLWVRQEKVSVLFHCTTNSSPLQHIEPKRDSMLRQLNDPIAMKQVSVPFMLRRVHNHHSKSSSVTLILTVEELCLTLRWELDRSVNVRS